MKTARSIEELIGNTPLLILNRHAAAKGLTTPIVAKLERTNPGGSAKDRIALYMIDDAEKSGKLKPGGTIVEPTSGNTGVGLAVIGASRGYKVILTMPETMSIERRKLLALLGAEIVLTPGKEGMNGAIAEAKRICAATPGAIMAGQFENPANPLAHYSATGPEIWRDTDGKVDIFVAGVGTGGTISGVGRYLKEKNPAVRIVAVEPAESPVLEGGAAGAHGIQGIGAGFVPGTYDASVVDEVVAAKSADAVAATKEIARTEGLLVGISSGAALAAATELALRPENKGKVIVALLPDTGERYLSTL
ncbi:MAG: cysteine synthase A [Paramuribaculum sp.]|nr:cysteine synthase A [Paramuribaculum sp.]